LACSSAQGTIMPQRLDATMMVTSLKLFPCCSLQNALLEKAILVNEKMIDKL